MKKRTHNIKTVEQIISIVSKKNVDCFISDFTEFILTTLEIKRIADLSGTPEFIWTDDNKPGLRKMTIEIVEKK